MISYSGADLGFSRGGGGGADLQKIFENFDDLFFDQIDFLSSSKALFCPYFFWQNFLRRLQIFEKTVKKKPFLGNFWKISKGAFRNILGSVAQKEGPFGSAGGRIPGGGGGRTPPTLRLKSAPDHTVHLEKKIIIISRLVNILGAFSLSQMAIKYNHKSNVFFETSFLKKCFRSCSYSYSSTYSSKEENFNYEVPVRRFSAILNYQMHSSHIIKKSIE